jgi:S-DNA-T family DNA segregation ATPase FtsK/SpoIIIE
MATTTTRRPASGRRPPARGRGGRGRSTRRKRAREPRFAALREQLSTQLESHKSDAIAVALAAAGIVCGLAVCFHFAGPFGRALDTGAGAVFGEGRFLLPLALLGGAAALVARSFTDDEDEEPERRGVRVGVGMVGVLLAAVGLLDLFAGRPDSQSFTRLRTAGGVLGALVAGPLAAALGPVGAGVVLVALFVFGFLLVAHIGLRDALGGVAALGRVTGSGVKQLFELTKDELLDGTESDDGEVEAAPEEPAHLAPAPFVQSTAYRRAVLFDQTLYDEEEEEEEEADDEEYEDEEYELDEEAEEEEEYEDEEEEYDEDEEYEDEDGEEEEEDDEVDLRPVAKRERRDWKLPAANILKRGSGKQIDSRLIDAGGEILEATMHEFGVDARLIGATVGPTVTRYELELAPGVKVSRVTGLSKEIAYAMASQDVRILAPIPGRSAIGVEVPNRMRPIVTLGDILATDEAKRAVHPLEVGMGRDIAGKSVLANLATFPHVLIAGATGAGKSSCINSIVTSILMRATPDQVRLILVDPKRVELGQYNGLPHLLTEVVVKPKLAANALEWAVREMEMRYDLLAEVGVRDITGYNSMFDRGELPTEDDPDPLDGEKTYERLPFILIVVDELNDLMMVAARDVEASICRIAQMARAVGIHLVIATQRPSVDVITGVIKANIPSRLAFAVSSLSDSRVILDQPGAEKLVGKGDMLLLAASSSRTERIQGSWVDEECVRKVVAHWRRQAIETDYVDGIQGDEGGGSGSRADAVDDEGDELLDEAMELVVTSGLGSTSMLQRKLRVGFARAGRIMDLLERRGVVGPSEGSKARSVLMTEDELEELRARV